MKIFCFFDFVFFFFILSSIRTAKILFPSGLEVNNQFSIKSYHVRHLTSDSTLPAEAQIVVCGGGIVGCSVAYHLAKLGWKDVLLLEQGK